MGVARRRRSANRWTYPADLTAALLEFGLAPADRTDPLFVRDALNDLYRYELRRLRDRYLANEFEKHEFHEHVIRLRKKYWHLTLLPRTWTKVCLPVPGSPF